MAQTGNYFDQFDGAPAPAPSAPDTNYFDQFDTGASPQPSVAPTGTAPNSPASMGATIAASQPHSFLDKFGHGAADTALQITKLAAHLAAGADQPSMGPALNDLSFLSPALKLLGGANSDEAAKMDAYAKQRENDWQASRLNKGESGFELDRLLGQTAAQAPLMAAIPAGEATSLMGNVAQGAVPGAVSGALMPTTGDGNFGAQTAQNTGIGALFGGATGGLFGKSADPTAQSNSDMYRNTVNYLRDRGVVLTPGQNIGPNAATIEDTLSGINLAIPGGQRNAIDTFQRGGFNEALSDLGANYTGPLGRDGFKNVSQVFDKAYDSIKSQISLPVPDSLRVQIGDIVSSAAAPDASIAKTTQGILDKALYSQIGEDNTLSGQGFKNAQEMLGNYIKDYSGDGATATERQVGNALKAIKGQLENSLEDANPAVAAQLKAINRGYAKLSILRDAVPVGNADSRFTPNQLASAVARSDNTANGRAYTEGRALMQKYSDAGMRVLGNKFPDSGTTRRLISSDPLAWPFQAAGTALGAPFYSNTGARAVGSVVNAASKASGLMPPVVNAARPLVPYSTPALMGAFTSGN